MAVKRIPIARVVTSELNPRRDFDSEYLNELSESLSEDGQWDPLIVREIDGEKYEVLSGGCRLRAAENLGWSDIRCNVIQADDQEAHLLALKTNLVRKNLNVIEEAEALESIYRKFSMSQKELGKMLGKKQSWISRRLSLASRLSDYCKEALREGEISACHGVGLAKLDPEDQKEVCDLIVEKNLGVRGAKSLIESRLKLKEMGIRRKRIMKKSPDDDSSHVDPKNAARYIRKSLIEMKNIFGDSLAHEEFQVGGELFLVVRVSVNGGETPLRRKDYPISYFDSFDRAHEYAKNQGGYCSGQITIRGERVWSLYLPKETSEVGDSLITPLEVY